MRLLERELAEWAAGRDKGSLTPCSRLGGWEGTDALLNALEPLPPVDGRSAGGCGGNACSGDVCAVAATAGLATGRKGEVVTAVDAAAWGGVWLSGTAREDAAGERWESSAPGAAVAADRLSSPIAAECAAAVGVMTGVFAPEGVLDDGRDCRPLLLPAPRRMFAMPARLPLLNVRRDGDAVAAGCTALGMAATAGDEDEEEVVDGDGGTRAAGLAVAGRAAGDTDPPH